MKRCRHVGIAFLCEYDSGEAYPKSPDEVENVYWMTAEEILSHQKAPEYLKKSIQLSLDTVRLGEGT